MVQERVSTRKQVYAFMMLPEHVQRARAQELDLIEDSDNELVGGALLLRWIVRAKEKGLTDELLGVQFEEKKTQELKTEHYQGFLPKGYAFCCPHCMYWKAYPAELAGGVRGILCAGGDGVIPPKCGKFTSEEEVISFKDMRMIEE